MLDLIQKALLAKRESKYIEFKENFDPNSPAEWCEIVKDIVAMANSGGGVIVFGLDSLGSPTGVSLAELAKIDPADFGNKLSKYTGTAQLEFEIRELEKLGQKLLAFVVRSVTVPIVFQKPGTYDVGAGRQKTAFGLGTVYFRHGAKSEPGNSEDIRAVIERQLESIRRSWIKGVRKVVQAPEGSQIITVRPSGNIGGSSVSPIVRAVKDPKATPVLLTRDRQKATGVFIHEEVSEGIFDEINNVIDANRVLARGHRRFLLGQTTYYRIYAERQYVVQREDDISLLFHSALCDLYAPGLFWTLALSEGIIAEILAELYLRPRSPTTNGLLRIAALLGNEFCDWLYERLQSKWKRNPQFMAFHFTLRKMRARAKSIDPLLAAARVQSGAQFQIGKDSVGVDDLIGNPQRAAMLLSNACMQAFESGDAELRSTARCLDYFAYGTGIRDRAATISRALRTVVADQEAGDIEGTPPVE